MPVQTVEKGQVFNLQGGPLCLPGGEDEGANVETLSAGKTIKVYESQFQLLNPNGSSRTITLPKITTPHHRERRGLFYFIKNTDSGAGALAIVDADAVAIVTIQKNETALVVSTGVTWRYFVFQSSENLSATYLPLAGGSMDDAANIATGTTTGSKLATNNTQKLGFWGATPVVQPSSSGEIVGSIGNGATNANHANYASNGNLGSTNMTHSDVVKVLKRAGLCPL